MNDNRFYVNALMASAAWFSWSSVAAAEVADAPASSMPPQAASSHNGLQDIVVTAQRRSERAQDVPISITTLSPAAIQNQGVKSSFDLTKVVPGLVYSASSGYAVPFIRGVGSLNTSPGDEPGVATYIDGVYIGNPILLQLPYGTVSGVEVLKGPQGTLFGRNATGGVVNVTLRGPEHVFSATGALSYESYRAIEGSLFVTGPLSDKVSASLDIGLRNQSRGYFPNDADGSRIGTQDYSTFRGKLRFEPTERLTVDLSADYQRSDNSVGDASGTFPGTVPLAAVVGAYYPTEKNHVFATVPSSTHLKAYGGSITAALDLDGVTLKSISSVRHTSYKLHIQTGSIPAGTLAIVQPNPGATNPDGTPVGTRTVVPGSTFYHTFAHVPYFVTQELQLASAKGQQFEWIIGGFAQWSKDGWSSLNVNYERDPAISFVEFRPGEQTTRAYAVFGQGTFKITPQLSAVGGIRYSTEKKSADGVQLVNGAQVATDSRSASFDGVSYRAGLNYKPADKALIYASISRGFKSGLYVVSNFGAPPVRPERLDDIEAGAKVDVARGLRVNVNAYRYNYKNMQVSAVSQGGLTALANAASARMKGIELEVQAVPLPGLTLSANGAYEHARYRSFPNAQVFLPSSSGGFYQTVFDASGKKMIRTPTWSGTVSANYAQDLGDTGSLNYNASYYRSGAFPWEYSGTLKQKAYGILDLSVEWQAPSKIYSVTVYANNATNTKYSAGVLPIVQGALSFWGKPAVFGARVRVKLD